MSPHNGCRSTLSETKGIWTKQGPESAVSNAGDSSSSAQIPLSPSSAKVLPAKDHNKTTANSHERLHFLSNI